MEVIFREEEPFCQKRFVIVSRETDDKGRIWGNRKKRWKGIKKFLKRSKENIISGNTRECVIKDI